MTYFGVLGVFILPPLVALVALNLWRKQADWMPYLVVLAHVVIAVAYTTPWDNYLVANGVWWYDEALVTGITLGWVPIEEYTFFVLQTLLTGFWMLTLMRFAFPLQPVREDGSTRRWVVLVLPLWIVSTVLLLAGWQPGIYLTLILSWALLPILSQLAFGADILLANRRLLAVGIIVPTVYLWIVDALAINSGTWTIDPAQTTGLKLGVLPVEEMIFFLVTNVLVASGVTLMLAPASRERAHRLWQWVRQRFVRAGDPHVTA